MAIHPCSSCDKNCNVLKLAAYQRWKLSVQILDKGALVEGRAQSYGSLVI